LSPYDRWCRELAKLFGHPGFRCLDKQESNVEAILRRAHKLYQDHLTEPTVDPQKRFVEMSCCLRDLFELKRLYHGVRDVEIQLSEATRMLAAVQAPIRAAAAMTAGFRPEPVSFCLQGAPGVGKTTMFQWMITAIMALSELIDEDTSAEDAAKLVFSKPWNSEYWEGYYNQPVVAMDDFGLAKIAPGDSSNCYLDLATIIGPFVSMVNTAACENKGMYSMNARLVAMTTNVNSMTGATSNAIEEPLAIVRRIHFPYEVKVKPAYQVAEDAHGKLKGSLDFVKFKEEFEKCGKSGDFFGLFPWHIWEFVPFNFVDGKSSGGAISAQQLICQIVKKMSTNVDIHDTNVRRMDRMLKTPKNVGDILDEYVPIQTTVNNTHMLAELRFGFKAMEKCEMDEVCPCCDRLNHMFESLRCFDVTCEYYNECFPVCEACHVTSGIHMFGPKELCHMTAECMAAREGFDFRKEVVDAYKVCYPPSSEDSFYTSTDESTSSEDTEGFLTIGRDNVSIGGLKEASFEKSWFYSVLCNVKKAFTSVQGLTRMADVLASVFLVGITFKLTVELLRFIGDIFSACWNYIRSMFGIKREKADQQSNRSIKAKSVSYQHLRPKGVEAQSQSSPQLANNVYDNSYKLIICTDGDGFNVFGQLTFLRGGLFVMPEHFIIVLKRMLDSGEVFQHSKIHLRSCLHSELDIAGGMDVGKFLDIPYHVVPDKDLAFGIMKGVNPKKDAMKFLVLEKELSDASNKAVRLDTARVDKNGLLVPWNERLAFMDPHVQYGTHSLQCGPIRHKRWWKYVADTQSGDCGAPLCLQRAGSFQHRVWLGIHVGGRDQYGYANVITREDADDAFSKLLVKDPHLKQYAIQNATPEETDLHCGIYTKYDVKFTEIDTFPFSEDTTDSFGSFTALYKINRPVSIPIKSKLVQTEAGKDQIFGQSELVPMKMGPFKDKDGKVVYPMVEALKPYSTPVKHIDEWWTESGIRSGLKKFSEASRHVKGRVLSYEEAVKGNVALGLKAIPRGTSTGFPCCETAKDKSYFWGDGDEYDLTLPRAKELQKEVESMEEMVLNGIRPFIVCRGFLKDETRKAHKGARYIAGTLVHYYILCRKYFGVIVATQMSNHTEAGMCPGICEYKDWRWLRSWIERPGGKCWDGDFEGFDSSQMPTFLMALLDYINEWYTMRGATPEENAARAVLFQDLVYSRHLVGKATRMDTVVGFNKSLPSGHFLTAFINSAQSMCCMSCAYTALTFRSDFWVECSAATLGDDNLAGASDNVIDEFNQVTLQKFLKDEFAMGYTSARKDGSLKPYYSIDDCEFLKRTFLVLDGYDSCPLALGSILHSMYYVRESKSAKKDDILMDMCETALGELSLHGAEVWEKWSGTVSRLMLDHGRAPVRATYNHSDYLKYMMSRVDSSWAGLQIRSSVGKNTDPIE
jgi:hypothetical protein